MRWSHWPASERTSEVIDARTIQALVNQAEAQRLATPVLSQSQLDAAIAATRPAPPDPDAAIRDAVRDAVQAGRTAGYQAGRQAGQREGIEAGTTAGIAMGRTLQRRGQ